MKKKKEENEEEKKEPQGEMPNFRGMFEGAQLTNCTQNFIWGNETVHVHSNGEKQDEEQAAETASSAKKVIIDYVNRLLPLVKDEYQKSYDDLWNGILEIKEVKLLVYDKGKQQDTSFNRNLVAQIVHQISDIIYLPTANATQMAECLEPGKGVDHSVRQKLGETPDKVIKKSIEKYIEEFK